MEIAKGLLHGNTGVEVGDELSITGIEQIVDAQVTVDSGIQIANDGYGDVGFAVEVVCWIELVSIGVGVHEVCALQLLCRSLEGEHTECGKGRDI